MIKVITYGTYDLLHHGHIQLLKRAKALGDYLIVGITSDSFDKARGKINVKQSIMERIEAIKATGLADKIIVEEYEGQKIDDIKRYDIDVFTVGSDWIGKFDYLKEYCQVIYLPRTKGISSSEIRMKERKIRLGLIGESDVLKKFFNETKYVNGIEISGLCTQNNILKEQMKNKIEYITDKIDNILNISDAIYILSHPKYHFNQIRKALEQNKHVLCESPIALDKRKCKFLFSLAKKNNCVLMEGIKTAYATAFNRLSLLVKSGCIGDIVSIDVTCTSLQDIYNKEIEDLKDMWNSITSWGPTAMLPVFYLLGTRYRKMYMVSKKLNDNKDFDAFTSINFIYEHAIASVKVGKGVKSEGILIISGTKGYIYVPAPWWKTDYFEIRYENSNNNRRYFYLLEGEGIRYEIVAFIKSIETKKNNSYITENISNVIEQFMKQEIYII